LVKWQAFNSLIEYIVISDVMHISCQRTCDHVIVARRTIHFEIVLFASEAPVRGSIELAAATQQRTSTSFRISHGSLLTAALLTRPVVLAAYRIVAGWQGRRHYVSEEKERLEHERDKPLFSSWQRGFSMIRTRADQITHLDNLINSSSWNERRTFIDMIRPFSLTLPQVAVLSVLERFQPSMLIGEISEMTLTPPSSMTHTLDRLVERGLVERTAHPTDRRAMLISLTSQGHQLVSEIQSARREHFAEICESLSDGELAQLAVLLDKMAHPPRVQATAGSVSAK
jgi:DNA-binding MarR family transcriptional regulator